MSFVSPVSGVPPPFAVWPRAADRDQRAAGSAREPPNASDSSRKAAADAAAAAVATGSRPLKPAEERLVQELQQIDQKVRAHEAAHQAVAGSLGGAASFTYRTGPDGKSYAVGGEVPIDMSSGRTPEETIARAEQVRAAALAPADPSSQDLAVAAQASQMEAAARGQMVAQQAAAQQAPAANGKGDAAPTPDQAPRQAASASASGSDGRDVGPQVAATIAAIHSERASAGLSTPMVQQLARLAAAAYRL